MDYESIHSWINSGYSFLRLHLVDNVTPQMAAFVGVAIVLALMWAYYPEDSD